MSDSLDETGLTLKSLNDIVDELETGMKSIYGDDINIDSDSPDGQAINLFAQACIDIREVIQDIYTSMDPDEASGVVLDQRVAINGLERAAGTYTQTPVELTTDRSVTLVGLDDDEEATDIPDSVFTVKDDAGTEFVLMDSVTLPADSTTSVTFRASDIGAISVTTGTITTAVTAKAGITGIDNPDSVSVQGVDEETDAALRLRRTKSTSIASTSYLDSIESNILALDGVSACIAEENTTDTVDSNGIPAHSVWVIVDGGDENDIAEILYHTKSAGAGWYGDTDVIVKRPNGRVITVSFDRPVAEDLYIKFTCTDTTGRTVDNDNLKSLIVENVSYGIGEDANNDEIICYVKERYPYYRITNCLVSLDNTTWAEYVELASIGDKFSLSTDRITIS